LYTRIPFTIDLTWSTNLAISLVKSRYQSAAIGYVAPFLVFIAAMAVEHALALPLQVAYPIRLTLTLTTLLLVSREEVKLRPAQPLLSIALGLVVFALWIAPDALFGYRHHWLFENSIVGRASGSLSPHLQRNPLFLMIRAAGSTLLVPIIEELFWRGWLMRWLIDRDFQRIPLGTYLPSAFWLTAALFASEHGPYWEVGLMAGVAYNWWMVHTRSLADCILAHAVTNGALAIYVVNAGAWRYWL
jgi:CAAX prenyl protease-like protein